MYKMTPGSASIVQQRYLCRQSGKEPPVKISRNHLITKDMLSFTGRGRTHSLLFFPRGQCKGKYLSKLEKRGLQGGNNLIPGLYLHKGWVRKSVI
jgi:hypothetical protein